MAEPSWADALAAWSALASALFGAIALVAVFYVGHQLRLQRTQLHRDRENLYLERYWSIWDRIAESEFYPGEEAARRRTVAIGAYLRLSEDQCDLRAADRVTNTTWQEWLDGMRTQLADPDFRAQLDAAPDDQLKNLKKLVTTHDGFEPSVTSPKVRQRRGL